MRRAEELPPAEDSIIRSAADAARRLAMYQDLRAFMAWLLRESRSVASRLAREEPAAAATDLAPLEAELLRFEESCRIWEGRRQELERGNARDGEEPGAPTREAAALARAPDLTTVEAEPRVESTQARTEAALAWSRESRLIAARAQLTSRAAREQASATKARARQVSALATRTRTERRDGAAEPGRH